MNKRQLVEWYYHDGWDALDVYDKMNEKYPDITLEWITEVYQELGGFDDDDDE